MDAFTHGTQYGYRARACRCDECRAWQAAKMRETFARQRLRKYGLTQDAYDALLRAQSGRCAICGTKAQAFDVDHDHETRAIRGLLCHACNVRLGRKDSAARQRAEVQRIAALARWHRAALRYLTRHN